MKKVRKLIRKATIKFLNNAYTIVKFLELWF